MKAASLKEIKQGLGELDQKQLVAACLWLVKFKKDNKELLTYLLFEREDEEAYINSVKEMLDELFDEINKSNLYLVKKSLRKIVRTANKFIKYSEVDSTETEILLHVAERFLALNLNLRRHPALENIYLSLHKKILKSIDKLHEDLQFDYRKKMKSLII
jgi:hypothetical protein